MNDFFSYFSLRYYEIIRIIGGSIFLDFIGIIHQWIYLLNEYSNTIYVFFYSKQISD